MSFLSVLIAYLLSRYTDIAASLQQDGWFGRGLDYLGTRYPASPSPFLVLVAGVSLMAGISIWIMPFGISFITCIAVLLYSLGRGHWRDYTANTLEALRTGKAENVWLALESEGNLEKDNSDALWIAIRRHAAYSYLHDLFSVFFWFCFLGPAGAFFACLLNLYNQSAMVCNARLPAFHQWQYAVEWLPARYMALCFCLAGNFNSCFNVWRQLALDTQLDTRDFLCRCLDAALVLEDPQPVGHDTPEQTLVDTSLIFGAGLQDLLARTEIIGLVGVALTVLLVN